MVSLGVRDTATADKVWSQSCLDLEPFCSRKTGKDTPKADKAVFCVECFTELHNLQAALTG